MYTNDIGNLCHYKHTHYIIISLYHYIIISLYSFYSLSHYIIISLYHFIILSLYHFIIISLYHTSICSIMPTIDNMFVVLSSTFRANYGPRQPMVRKNTRVCNKKTTRTAMLGALKNLKSANKKEKENI